MFVVLFVAFEAIPVDLFLNSLTIYNPCVILNSTTEVNIKSKKGLIVMRKEEMEKVIGEFLTRCIQNDWDSHHNVSAAIEMWERADTLGEFKMMLREDERTMYGHACGELNKCDFRFIREMLGDECFTTTSDAGGLKIGNGALSMIIPNGWGDGDTHVAILSETAKFNFNALDYFTRIDGECDIYSYDCHNGDIVRHITGTYQVYTGGGFVVFRELREEAAIQ